MNGDTQRLIVVSNRLPVVVTQDSEGHHRLERGSGGLVTALCPVLQSRSGVWFGWTGGDSDAEVRQLIEAHSDECGHSLRPVELTFPEADLYYNGFANEILWPLFHDFIWLCNFDPDYWPAYQAVNLKFAHAVRNELQPGDFVWVHDYHLLLVGAGLRRMEVPNKLGFFLHIPFPSVDGFTKIPWRTELLLGMLEYDLVGFQTVRDMQNFVRCVRSLVPDVRTQGEGKTVTLKLHDRQVRVGAFPISIDYHGFARGALGKDVEEYVKIIRGHIGSQQLVLGIDRLDYTKGIPRRVGAFAEALRLYPELRRRITFLQVIVPSRTDVPRYQTLKDDIERTIGQINGEFAQPGWTPIQYMYRRLCQTELLAYYRCADIALVTPLKDGMNLISKEYCSSNLDKNGVVVLSEFAGAAAQLFADVLLVNPFDKKAVAHAIYRAFNMDSHERARRMSRLRQAIRRNDVFHWVDSFLRAAAPRPRSENSAGGQ